jgi:hypothetical protein
MFTLGYNNDNNIISMYLYLYTTHYNIKIVVMCNNKIIIIAILIILLCFFSVSWQLLTQSNIVIIDFVSYAMHIL